MIHIEHEKRILPQFHNTSVYNFQTINIHINALTLTIYLMYLCAITHLIMRKGHEKNPRCLQT